MRLHTRFSAIAALVAGIVVLVFMTGVAQALLVKMSPQKMTRVSQRVVVADVWSVSSRHVKPAQGRGWGTVVTVVRLRVTDRLKGASPSWLTLRIPGGTAAGRTLVVEDTPAFYPGERVLLFLDDHGVVGWRQGALEIVDGEVAAWDVSLGAAKRRIAGDPVGELIQGRRDASASVGAARTVTTQAMATILNDGFETSMANWSLNPASGWNRTTNRKQAGSYSAYCVQAVAPAPGPYPNSTTTRMTYGPFSLADAATATFDFDLWKTVADPGDTTIVYFGTKADGSDMYGWVYDDTGGSWGHDTVDLSAVPDGAGGTRSLLGQPSVYIRFRFQSSAGGQAEGAYVDNVAITKNVVSVSDPTITNIDPSSASAGTGTNVTITGTNFGATQGAGGVTFYYDSTDRIPAPIVSWSDTQIVCTVPTATIKGYAASAGSGPVIVANDAGGSSQEYAFTVTFSYGGAKWVSPNVTYRLNANCADTADETALIDAAWPTWNPPALWTLTRSGTCTTTALPESSDGFRDIFWSQSSLGTGVPATNQVMWYESNPDQLIDSDIAFNDVDFTWGDGSGGTFDVQSVALHELGHTIFLRDQYGPGDTGDVMYGLVDSGTQKRTLSADDIAGVVWVYGARPPMTGTVRVAGDASYTATQSVTLSSAVVNATQMRFSNDNTTWPSGWEPYAATRNGWSLTAGDGGKTVYGQYKDAGGNVFAQTDAIVLDATAPVTTDNHDGLPHQVFTLVLSPIDATSGVALTQYRIDGGSWKTGTAALLRLRIRHKRPGLARDTHTVEYRSTDAAGNLETVKSCQVILGG